MASERFTELILELLDATRAKKVRWSEGTNPDHYRIGFRSGIVAVSTSADKDGDVWYHAMLLNAEDKVLDDWSAYSGDAVLTLSDLHSAARASALDLDGVISGILTDLREGKTVEIQDNKPPF